MMDSLAPLANSSLLDLVVRATILLSVALALVWLARRGPAGVRHLLWTMTFSLLLGLPVFSFLGLSWEVPLVPSADATSEQRSQPIPSILAGADGSVALSTSEPSLPVAGSRAVRVGEPESPARSIPRPLLFWGVGCAIGLISLLLGGVRFARLVRTASPLHDPTLLRHAEAVRWRLGIHGDVRLLLSRAATIPMTGGLFRPVILFPASAAEWSAERWRVVLMHEMIHVRRRDVLRQLMARFVLALYWFHPLSWVAARLAAIASEEACDQEVLTLGTRPSVYAGHLLALAGTTSTYRSVLTLPMGQQSPSQLEKRIMAILTPFRPGRSGIGTALMVAALSGTGVSATIVQPVQQRNVRINDTPIFTIGDEVDDPLYDLTGAVLTDDALILAEWSTHSLRFHDRETGELLHTVGQRGEGPGDYLSLDLLQAVDDRLYTFDGRNMRVTILNGTGDVERTVRVRPWGDYNIVHVDGFFPDGSVLTSAHTFSWEQAPMIRRFEHELARHDPDGTFADRLGTHLSYEHYASPERMNIFPYRREVWVVVVGDRYHIVDNKDPVIRAFDAAGELVDELQPHMPLEPTRITSAGRDSLPELEGIDDDDLPRFYPFYGRPRVAGGALWVPDYPGLAPGGGSAWTVYSAEGDLVRRVTASEIDMTVLDADDDVVAVLLTDELGVETVELRRIIEGP